MRTEEEIKQDIETWKDVNPILLNKFQLELKELNKPEIKDKEDIVIIPPKVEKRIAEFKEDLLDDGKRNYSTKKKKNKK